MGLRERDIVVTDGFDKFDAVPQVGVSRAQGSVRQHGQKEKQDRHQPIAPLEPIYCLCHFAEAVDSCPYL
jgi:hypothetical protein